VAFRREKYIEFGGPSGGNGGRGGDVISKWSMIEHADRLSLSAALQGPEGTNGMGKDRHGANGKPIVLKVPVGTQISMKTARP